MASPGISEEYPDRELLEAYSPKLAATVAAWRHARKELDEVAH